MGTKNYSVNRKEDGLVIFEVDGALYTDLSQVPDEADRTVLAGLLDGTPDWQPGDESWISGGEDGPAPVTDARMRTIFLVAFGGIAILMLLVAAVTSYDAFLRSGIEVQAPGMVVDTVEETDSDDTVYSYPVVEFTDQSGRTHTVKIREGSSPPAWYEGDSVTVLYDPENPEDARTDSLSGTLFLWLAPGVSGILGISFLLATLVILKVMPSGNKR